jgi:hypothetical protein
VSSSASEKIREGAKQSVAQARVCAQLRYRNFERFRARQYSRSITPRHFIFNAFESETIACAEKINARVFIRARRNIGNAFVENPPRTRRTQPF